MKNIFKINEAFWNKKKVDLDTDPYSLFTNREYLEDLLVEIEDKGFRVRSIEELQNPNRIKIELKFNFDKYNDKWSEFTKRKLDILLPFCNKIQKIGYKVKVVDYGYETGLIRDVNGVHCDFIINILRKEKN